MKKPIFALMILFIMGLLTSCSEDDAVNSSSFSEEANFKKESISYFKFIHSYPNKEYLNNLSDLLITDENLMNAKNGNQGYIIDTTDIRMIQIDDVTTYTFRVLNNSNELGFQNIILKDENNQTNLFLVSYPENFDLINLNEEPTQIELQELNPNELNNSPLFRSGGSCIYITPCSEGIHHGGNIGSWGNCTASRPPVMNIAPCDDGNNGVGGPGEPGGPPNGSGNPGHNGPGPNPGGGGSGGGSNMPGGSTGGGPNPGQHIPTDPMPDLQSAQQLHLLLLLNYSQKQWLNQNPSVSNKIWNYVQSVNNSYESKQFAKKLIHLLIDTNYKTPAFNSSNYPGKENGMTFNWWNNSTHLNNMSLDPYDQFKKLTKQEKILVAIWPEQAYKIYKNKPVAETMTTSVMGHNGRNDKSDAFRHAFFNAINTRDIWGGFLVKAADIVRLFGEAHESEVPANLNKEKVMDLYNNDIGIAYTASFFSGSLSNSQISDAIYYFLVNGNLRYLSPLAQPIVPPNYGITAQTQLTPTNN